MWTWQSQLAHKFAVLVGRRSGQILESNKKIILFTFCCFTLSKLISCRIGLNSGAGLVGKWAAPLRRRHSSNATLLCGREAILQKGVTLASKCAAVQQHILLWGKVRNWKVSAGSWVIGICYYCVPPPPFNNLFIKITLLQISLCGCKT